MKVAFFAVLDGMKLLPQNRLFLVLDWSYFAFVPLLIIGNFVKGSGSETSPEMIAGN